MTSKMKLSSHIFKAKHALENNAHLSDGIFLFLLLKLSAVLPERGSGPFITFYFTRKLLGEGDGPLVTTE